MADGKRRYKSDRKDYKISVKLSEKDMDILKVALKRTGMTASAYIRELIRTGGNIDTSYYEDRARAIRVIAGIANNINQAVKLGICCRVSLKMKPVRSWHVREREQDRYLLRYRHSYAVPILICREEHQRVLIITE